MESISSRSSSVSLSLGHEIVLLFIQEGQGCVTPRPAGNCEGVEGGLEAWFDASDGSDLKQEHSGTGKERKDDDFEFVDSSANLSIKFLLRCLRTDVIQVRLASYKWSRISSICLATSFLS